MNRLARKLAHLLAENAGNSSYHEDEVRYGLEIFLGGLLQIIIIMAVALLLGIAKEVLAIIIPAAVYRRYADGPHCQAYYRCTIASLVNFILLGYISRYIPTNYLPMYITPLIVLTILIIHYYVPAENPINPVTDEAIRRTRKQKSYLVMLVILLISMFAAYYMEEKPVAIAILLGLFWQNITLLPGGQAYIHLWDRFFETIEEKLKREEGLKC